MTDVVTTPDAPAEIDADAVPESDAPAGAHDGADGSGPLQWAPAPERRRRRWPLALWIGLPALALIGGATWAGLTLIAPGVTVAGVPLGGLTVAAAQERLAQAVATTDVELTLGSTTATITGADLGATIDAASLAQAAHASNPMWQLGTWFPEPDRTLPTIDPDTARTALATAFDAVWTAPVDASVAFDEKSSTYVVTAGEQGEGIEASVVEDAYLERLLAPDSPAALDQPLASLDPDITTAAATAKADELNALLASAGFYVGEERTVPVDAATTASWLTLTADPDQGTIDVTADEDAIQSVVDGLKEKVDRDAVDGSRIVNEAGTVLREGKQGQQGRTLTSTTGVAAAFATQLAGGDGVFALDVEVVEPKTADVVRLLEVDLSAQHMYVKENGKVVDSWTISSGMPGWDTRQGHFTVNYKVRMQDMGNPNVGYLQPDVEWVMYFSGDQAFHAVYWRPTTPVPQSHGCVGMPTWRAQWLYEWADVGTDVWVHS